MKIFVTGGAGFIGSNYVRHVLAHTDDEVTIYDALTYAGNLSTLRDVDDDPRTQFVKGNICDPAAIEQAMAGHDAVVHFAAESHVDRSISGPDDFIHTNCFGTNIVMDTARRLDVGRVVHIGTDEVYGSVEIGSSKETDPLEPRSPYSASKAGSDLIALSYHHTYGVPVVVTRCTNNFGPFQYPEKVIPLFTTNLLDGKSVPLYGDGLNERDWIHVDDHCAGVHLALQRGEPGEIYNIGAGNETPNRVLVDKLLALLGRGEELVEYVADRLGHDRRYSVDIAKITALGWTRKRTLDEALAETVAWYRENRWWWEPLKVRGVKVFVTGAGGQVGHEVSAGFGAASRHEVIAADHAALDVGDRDAVMQAITSSRPDVIVHCAVWTAVDACEADADRVFRVNALGTRHVAEAARVAGAHLLCVSTDYVFDGTKTEPYLEWDAPNPRSVYGRSKLAGEIEAGPDATIVRISWVCGEHGSNMVKTILRLAAEHETLSFVDDQRGHPTFTTDLAPMIQRLVIDRRPGVFHVTNQGAVSWFEFAGAVLAAAGLDPARVLPISTAELQPPRPAPRPANSVLDNAALRLSDIELLPDFHEPLARLVAALTV